MAMGRPCRASCATLPGQFCATFGVSVSSAPIRMSVGVALLHVKTMTIDGIWTTIGSTNLDTRSFALNDEVNAVIYHNEVVGQLEKIFALPIRGEL